MTVEQYRNHLKQRTSAANTANTWRSVASLPNYLTHATSHAAGLAMVSSVLGVSMRQLAGKRLCLARPLARGQRTKIGESPKTSSPRCFWAQQLAKTIDTTGDRREISSLRHPTGRSWGILRSIFRLVAKTHSTTLRNTQLLDVDADEAKRSPHQVTKKPSKGLCNFESNGSTNLVQ